MTRARLFPRSYLLRSLHLYIFCLLVFFSPCIIVYFSLFFVFCNLRVFFPSPCVLVFCTSDPGGHCRLASAVFSMMDPPLFDMDIVPKMGRKTQTRNTYKTKRSPPSTIVTAENEDTQLKCITNFTPRISIKRTDAMRLPFVATVLDPRNFRAFICALCCCDVWEYSFVYIPKTAFKLHVNDYGDRKFNIGGKNQSVTRSTICKTYKKCVLKTEKKNKLMPLII